MVIDLKPEQQRVIDLAVGSGAYQNPDEVLDQAFEIIREQLDLEDWMREQREAVAAHIGKGFAQAERGGLIDGDAVVARRMCGDVSGKFSAFGGPVAICKGEAASGCVASNRMDRSLAKRLSPSAQPSWLAQLHTRIPRW